jgi:hypothetical protein
VLQVDLRQMHNVIPLSLPVTRSGLGPWQLPRAKETMCSRLQQGVPLAEPARAVSARNSCANAAATCSAMYSAFSIAVDWQFVAKSMPMLG